MDFLVGPPIYVKGGVAVNSSNLSQSTFTNFNTNYPDYTISDMLTSLDITKHVNDLLLGVQTQPLVLAVDELISDTTKSYYIKSFQLMLEGEVSVPVNTSSISYDYDYTDNTITYNRSIGEFDATVGSYKKIKSVYNYDNFNRFTKKHTLYEFIK